MMRGAAMFGRSVLSLQHAYACRVARQPERRSNGAVPISIEAVSPPKRRSVLDRLGPRLGDPSSDSDAPGSSRQPAARASSSEQAERPAKRQSSRVVSSSSPS